jgi:hypothetical protein
VVTAVHSKEAVASPVVVMRQSLPLQAVTVAQSAKMASNLIVLRALSIWLSPVASL